MSAPEDVILPDGRKIGDLKVADLRTQLEIRGLSRSGVKKDLCARLSGAVDVELRQEREKSETFDKPVESDGSLIGTNNVQNEDTLEIDAVASDEEITEVSASVDVTEVNVEIPKTESFCKSPSVSTDCGKLDLNNSETSIEISNVEITKDAQNSDLPISTANDAKSETEVQPVRRRQWGSRSITSTPSLSSESLEKLIPPASSCWLRNKSMVVDNENNNDIPHTSSSSLSSSPSVTLPENNNTSSHVVVDHHVDDVTEKKHHDVDVGDHVNQQQEEVEAEEDNSLDHMMKNQRSTDYSNNHDLNEEEDHFTSHDHDNNNNDRHDNLHREREVELEVVDAVVENMDTYDENINNNHSNNTIEDLSNAYDSRTVHLTSSDISPKLDVIIKRGSMTNTISTTITSTMMTTITATVGGGAATTTTPTLTQSTDQTSAEQRLQSNSSQSSVITKKSPPPPPPAPQPKRKGPKETKAVGYLVEPPERIEPMQPAKHTQTDIVYIRFLVRPFTGEQLRQMIVTHYGPVVDLWLDKIKSSSLVRLQSVEYATKCRDGLDGSRWPSMNPRVLRCDYASIDLFEWMKVNGDSNDLQPPKHLLLGGDNSSSNVNTTMMMVGDKPDNDFMTSSDKKPTDLRRKLERSNRDVEQPVSVNKSRQGDIKEAPIGELKPKTEEPAKLLNNLFRKTIATPSVYWLPLTSEQVNRRMKKMIVEKKSSTKTMPSRHSSYRSDEPVVVVQKATRSPFANSSSTSSSASASSSSSRTNSPRTRHSHRPTTSSHPSSGRVTTTNNNPMRKLSTTTTDHNSSRAKIPDSKLSSNTTSTNTKSSNDNSKQISTNKKPLSNHVLYDSKRPPTDTTKSKSMRDIKAGGQCRDIVDDNKQPQQGQSRLSKPDHSSNNSNSLKVDKTLDNNNNSNNSRKPSESSPPLHSRKRRYSKTDSDEKEMISAKQSRPNITSSSGGGGGGDSSVVGEALAAYKKNHTGSQHHRSDQRRRSSSNRHSSPPNRHTSYKNSYVESSRLKSKPDSSSISHSRDHGRRRSRSFNHQRHRSSPQSTNNDRRDRSSSNRYRSRR